MTLKDWVDNDIKEKNLKRLSKYLECEITQEVDNSEGHPFTHKGILKWCIISLKGKYYAVGKNDGGGWGVTYVSTRLKGYVPPFEKEVDDGSYWLIRNGKKINLFLQVEEKENGHVKVIDLDYNKPRGKKKKTFNDTYFWLTEGSFASEMIRLGATKVDDEIYKNIRNGNY